MDDIDLSLDEMEDFINSKGWKFFHQEFNKELQNLKNDCVSKVNIRLYRAQGGVKTLERAMDLPQQYIEIAQELIKADLPDEEEQDVS